MSKVIFHCLPPTDVDSPSPAFSILKSFLKKHGHDVEVIYWNILFRDLYKYYFGESLNSELCLLPFLYRLNKDFGNEKDLNRIYARIKSECPSLFLTEKSLNQDFILKLENKFIDVFRKELSRYNSEEITLFGISSMFDQWVPGLVLSKELKHIFPNTPIVMGGIGTPDSAKELLKLNTYIDYAIWGEGEYPLIKLLDVIQNAASYKVLERTILRSNEELQLFNCRNHEYINIADSKYLPEYDDYFNTACIQSGNIEVTILIEAGRSCHWKKCSFCFLNQGYKFRRGNPDDIFNELIELKNKYKTKNFIFISNDLISGNIESFNSLLDNLIKYNENEEVPIKIFGAEIIPLDIDANVVKKMRLAGFEALQIGYEAVSDKLLQKINKKQSLADNILFIKLALKFGIEINGANVIVDLIDEDEDDILESIENLHFLRFFLGSGKFTHRTTPLAISFDSKYYKKLSKEDIKSWNLNSVISYLPSKLIMDIDIYKILEFQRNNRVFVLWASFDRATKHYIKNKYFYSILKVESKIVYKEFCNEKEIKTIIFDKPVYLAILELSNHKVTSFDDLNKDLNSKGYSLNKVELKLLISELKTQFLLYSNTDMSKIVSIIDISISGINQV